jgi:hypothetical protein
LDDFDAVPRPQDGGRMGATGDNLHVHSYRSTITIGNTKSFEQTPHRTLVWNEAFFAVNVDFDHKP